ncbi:hypothetical protein [Halopelagius fulvigenes]|uniref:Uncharacterized protein n=1 Tax=Halopelagius fulvigenes TaxID=1198324 RepID=A0ABD5TWS6_9EURY
MDYGDGRPGNPGGAARSVDQLDQETLTVCKYKIQYRGTYGNTPFLDTGWIKSAINCKGYDDNGTYNFITVHKTDPRYTGERPPAYGGEWEYHVDTESGLGNKLVRPHSPR